MPQRGRSALKKCSCLRRKGLFAITTYVAEGRACFTHYFPPACGVSSAHRPCVPFRQIAQNINRLGGNTGAQCRLRDRSDKGEWLLGSSLPAAPRLRDLLRIGHAHCEIKRRPTSGSTKKE